MEEARILIVEDESIIAHGLQGVLQSLGYVVPAIVYSGEEAIHKAAELRPDLVLMDIVLAGEIDGIEAAAQIRARFGIPAIYMTAYSDNEILQRARVTEPFGYILKPFVEREVHAIVQMALYKRRMEEKLAESESRYRAVSELTSDFAFSFRVELDGTLVPEWTTEALTRITGYTLAGTVARGDWEKLVHPDDLPNVLEQLETILSGHSSVSECRFTTARGEEKWLRVLGRSVRDESQGRIVRIIGAAQDITEQVRARHELHRSEERFRMLFECAPDGYFLNNLNGTFVDLNRAAEELTGYKKEELVGKSFLESSLLSAALIPKAATLLTRDIVGQATEPDEFVLNHRDGRQVPVEIRTFPAEIDGQALVLGVARDITERKRAEETLRRAYDESEMRVQQRTAELSAANEKLKQEIAERMRTEEALRQHARELNALNTLSRQVSATLSLDQVIEAALAGTADSVAPDLVMLFLQEEDELRLQGTYPENTAWRRGAPEAHRVGQCLCGLAAGERKPLYSSNIHTDSRVTLEECRVAGICSFAALPLLKGSDVLGVLGVASVTERDFREQAAFLEALTGEITIGLQNAFLYRQVQHHAAELEEQVVERTRAEEQVRAQNKFLNNVLESLTHPFYVIDANDYTIRAANSAAGFDECSGYLTCYALTHGRDKPCAGQEHPCPIEEVKRTKKPATVDHVHYDSNGNTRNVEIHSYPVMDSNGDIAQIIEYALDVTERVRLQEQLGAVYRLGQELTLLRDEQVIVQRALETVSTVLQFQAVHCGFVDEEAGELVYRYGLIDGVPKTDKLKLPLDGERGIGVAVVRDGQALNVPDTTQDPRYAPPHDGRPSRSELCVPMKVGRRIIGVLAAEYIEPDHLTSADQQLLQTLADQTATALENARLYLAGEHRAARLSALNDISAAAVSSLDPDVILPRILDLTCQFLGTEEGSILLKDPDTDELVFALDPTGGSHILQGRRLAPGQGIAGWVAQHGQSVCVGDARSDVRFHAEVDVLTGFETRSLLCAPLIHRDKVTGVIEIVGGLDNQFGSDDVDLLEAVSSIVAAVMENARLYDEQKTLLRERERAQAQLIHSEKMSALGRLVASIAHEINNPLQSMQGCLTLVIEEIAGQQRQERLDRYLGIIGEEIDRISAILRNMRDFYRTARTRSHPTDIHAVLASVLALSGKQLQHSNVVVEHEWADNLPSIQANSDHLKQVFLNMVLNAVDAMPQGGTLRVRTSRDQIQTGIGQPSQPAVRIEFSDTGTGMSPEIQTRLFEPFFTTKESGSGLGLSISYGIVESHDGQIVVTSQEGEGTTFTILLPVRNGERET